MAKGITMDSLERSTCKVVVDGKTYTMTQYKNMLKKAKATNNAEAKPKKKKAKKEENFIESEIKRIMQPITTLKSLSAYYDHAYRQWGKIGNEILENRYVRPHFVHYRVNVRELESLIDSITQYKNEKAVFQYIEKLIWKIEDIKELRNVHFTIASDVKNPLYGENGAAYVFAPQKGATPTMVRHLDARARKFAELSAKHFGYDCSEKEGAGAAGGLGYAFLQYLNAECRPGIDLLLNIVHFGEIVKDADLVITGEGSADRQTLMGKLPMGILRHSGNVPVCLIAGRISDREHLLKAGFAHVECMNPPGITLEEAMRPEVARQHLSRTAIKVSVLETDK